MAISLRIFLMTNIAAVGTSSKALKAKNPRASPQREARTRGLIFSESMLILASRCGLAGPYGMAVVRKTRSPQMMGVECPLPGKNHDHALILGPGQKAKDALDIENTINHPSSRHRSGDVDETMAGYAFIMMGNPPAVFWCAIEPSVFTMKPR